MATLTGALIIAGQQTVDAFLDIIRTEKTRQIFAAQLKAFEKNEFAIRSDTVVGT